MPKCNYCLDWHDPEWTCPNCKSCMDCCWCQEYEKEKEMTDEKPNDGVGR